MTENIKFRKQIFGIFIPIFLQTVWGDKVSGTLAYILTQ